MWLRELFADELGPDPSALPLRTLARDLERLEGDSDADDGASSDEPEADPPTPVPDSAAAVGEKKRVAVLVGEVVGLTDVSATLEPEDLLRQEEAILETVRRQVERHEGWMDRYVHDTVTALFGLPLAHEDDLERCLSCAKGLLRAFERLRLRGHPVDLALGVHVGEIAVTGDPERPDVVARGDTLKLARRLAGAAEPGHIVLSDDVAALCGDRWRVSAGPRLRRRGGGSVSRTHTLLGRRRRARAGPGERWIRRGDELERLAAALDALAEGRGGVLAILGEAGAGKSRLVAELTELSARARVPMYSARAIPYGGDRPLAAFRDLVASAVGIEDGDGADRLRERLSRLSELRLEDSDIAIIGALFAVELGGETSHAPDAQLTAGARMVRGLAEEGPVLLALEDVHDMGPQERALLGHLVQATSDNRVLWLVSARDGLPDELPAPDGVVRLGPLTDDQVYQLTADLVGVRSLSARLFDTVARRAEGNPLYVVELVSALQQQGLVRIEGRQAGLARSSDDPVLPPTLEGLIASRVDALDPAVKGALQLAATIGLTFSPALVAESAGLEQVEPLVRDLLASGLIVRARRQGACAFASQLIWEVVRRSILEVRRRDHHRMVAEGIERLYADHLSPHYEALAGHQHAAGRGLEAAETVELAGDQHRRAAFLERALRCYRRGVRWLEKLDARGADADARDRLEAALRLKAGEVALLLGEHLLAEQTLQVALDIAADMMLSEIEMGCFLALGRLYAATGRPVIAQANLEQGRVLARALDVPELEVAFLESLGSLACDRGEYASAEASLTEALELAGDDDHLAAIANLGLGTRFWRSGDAERALERLEFARAHAEAANDPILLGRVVNNLGIVHHAGGRFDRALAYFREALELRRGTGYRPGVVINLHNIGDALLRLGERGRAFAAFQRSRDAAMEVGLARGVAMNEVYLGYLSAVRGQPTGMALLSGAADRAKALGDEETALTGRWLEGRLLLKEGQVEDGRALLQAALDRAHALGAEWIARDIRADLAGVS
ncbi:MAG: tetratricopeptide repeat protein [Alphaproteobacteria bacterium]|nr:tetratricopeptide repeat protein [Alphaproteobacteria bacterium]